MICKDDVKIILNEWEDPKLSEVVYVGKGDYVYASQSVVEYGFTKNKKYKILGIVDYEYLRIKNDKGIIDDYSTEYFNSYESV